ncbi:RND transporter, HAE1/HME family, permease protein [Rhodopirellula maiorica SM1]|uniref:RND transporter, HAE1/HME family, permease protein n=1 Tax=Rhodopirellula maiorica SM1 TaxID=1265738 RepID=M5S5N9_9BACT|nr:efflux RND transporter permease subunit [Rhodopirellula maiorica]EMI22972.1 RND transporter, HAE1/HME family, permease protein [Rhodopirellula maiorica SM1]
MIDRFARHPTLANLLMLLFIIAGLFALPKLERETFPEFSATEIQIRILYLGATAEEVEEAVCRRVEDAIDGVENVKEVRSEAQEGVAVITVEMRDGADIALFQDDIESEVEAITEFPADVEDPVITQLGRTEAVMVLLVTGPLSTGDLKIHCENLKDRLQQVPQVSPVELEGFSDRQLRVELSDEALRRYGLTAAEVARVIARQGIDIPAGALETRDNEVLLRFVEQRRTPEELEDLIIKGTRGGAEIRLRDLGQVVDVFEDEEVKSLLGSERAGVLRIKKTKTQDAIRVTTAVREFLEQERQRQPLLNIAVVNDMSTLIRDRLELVLKNAVQGIILVFCTLWMFFNLRMSFWVVMSLPVSFLGALFLMPMLGLTINMITLVAMLLATGILMDDGIVISENIARHLSLGKPAMQAAVDGVKEVSGGVVSSFLTTICVLGPLVSLSGFIGKVLQVIPMVLILVLAVSLIEAFIILPAHLGHSLGHSGLERAGRLRRSMDGVLEWLRESVLGRCVDTAIRWRYLFLGSIAGLFVASLALVASGIVPFQGFPTTEGEIVEARILLPQGTPVERTEEIVQRISDGLEKVNRRFTPDQPDGRELVEIVQVQFGTNADAFESGSHVATVTADLLSPENRATRIDAVVQAWREAVGRLPDVISVTYGESSFGPAGRPIEIRFQSEDLSDAKQAAQQALTFFDQYQGVFNLTDDLRPGKQEYRIRLDEGAVGLGLDVTTIADQVRAAFQGTIADEIQVGSEAYEIVARLKSADRDSLADFSDFHIVLADGSRVPLSAVAKVEVATGWSRIARLDGRRTVTLIGEVDTRVANTASLMGLFRRNAIAEIRQQHPNVSVQIEGESQESAETGNSMLQAFVLGLIGVFAILSYQFESWTEPLIVMAAIPLALIGVIWGHLITGNALSIPSVLGFVSLAGVVVNDSILLVLFLKQEHAAGSDVVESARQASRLRFRAILLTSATTIAGLTPLLFETSRQAQVLIPLAVSVCFGLLSSTVLVLIAIPAAYVVLFDFGLIAKQKQGTESQTIS